MSSQLSSEPLPPARCVGDLVSREIAWLWPGRLALGKLAILEGDPGLGKSLLALDLCARLSTGRPFADDVACASAEPALVLNGEDSAEDTIRPRLLALGADVRRVFVLGVSQDGDVLLRLPQQTDTLEAALKQTRARLVVIDPIVTFLEQSVNTCDDASVRRALWPLRALAEKHQCSILLVRHLNKGAGRAVYRGSGSVGFVGACRSAWLVARDPQAPERRVLAQVKNNLAPAQPSLAFTFSGASPTRPPEKGAPCGLQNLPENEARQRDSPLQRGTVPIAERDCPPQTAPQLTWLGTSPWQADQLAASHVAGATACLPRERARDFLATLLEDGPRTSQEVWEEAVAQGVSKRTLSRSKRELGIRSTIVSRDGRRTSYWLLPHQKLSKEVMPENDPYDLEPWLAPLREKYPPRNPLDDL